MNDRQTPKRVHLRNKVEMMDLQECDAEWTRIQAARGWDEGRFRVYPAEETPYQKMLSERMYFLREQEAWNTPPHPKYDHNPLA